MAQTLADKVIDLLGAGFGTLELQTIKAQSADDLFPRLQDVSFHCGGQDICGYYLPPRSTTPAPAVLYCHAHGAAYDIGRDELVAGRPALTGPYLQDLADAGYAVLCLDMPCFGTRATDTESALAKAYAWRGDTLFGRMLAELQAGLGWLAQQPGVDPARLGTLGISMGGTHACWLAALEPRVAASVNMCCLADLEMLVDSGAHDAHGPYMTVPGLIPVARTGQLAGLAVPRPLLTCVGLKDAFTPEAAFAQAQADITAAYGPATDAVEVFVSPDTGHEETPAMRAAVLAFLARRL